MHIGALIGKDLLRSLEEDPGGVSALLLSRARARAGGSQKELPFWNLLIVVKPDSL